MRIFFNRAPVRGPWGGGSKVLSSIIDQCLLRNHDVTFDINVKSDIIFCMDPRPNQVTNFNTLLFMRQRDKSKIIQRIGDLGTHGKPDLLSLVKGSSSFSDHLVFPSRWAKDKLGINDNKSSIIHNAPLPEFIKSDRVSNIDKEYSLVTHHWSDNHMKGFDTYEFIDKSCEGTGNVNFTYVGRKPESVNFKNYKPPKDTPGLIEEFKKHNLYITASKQEAGANHVLEAIASGLPVLYHKDGGSIVEYCQDYGVMYDNNDHLMSILKDASMLSFLIQNQKKYTRDSIQMSIEYVDLIEKIYENKH